MHLMLKFEAIRDSEKGGEERMDLVFIDTDTGKVVELGFDAFNVLMSEREPTWAEMDSATKTLGKAPAGMVTKAEVDELQQKLKMAENRVKRTQKDLEERDEKISGLDRQIQRLKSDQTKDENEIVANALDIYIEEMAAVQDFDRYEAAKRIFKRVAGRKWVEDGSDDDDEGDLST